MLSIVIIVLLAVLVGWAVTKMIRRSKKGGGCCGEHEERPKRVFIGDRNKSHYPYKLTLTIGGMTCENCAIRVENHLNTLPGVFAKVNIDDKKAAVFSKEKPNPEQLRRVVSDAGYVVMDLK